MRTHPMHTSAHLQVTHPVSKISLFLTLSLSSYSFVKHITHTPATHTCTETAFDFLYLTCPEQMWTNWLLNRISPRTALFPLHLANLTFTDGSTFLHSPQYNGDLFRPLLLHSGKSESKTCLICNLRVHVLDVITSLDFFFLFQSCICSICLLQRYF